MFTDLPSKSISIHGCVSEYVDRYECALTEHPNLEIEAFLPSANSPIYSAVLSELSRVRLEWHWKQGNEKGLEELLLRYPAILSNVSILTEVTFEDYRLRTLSGRPASLKEYREQYRVDTSSWPTNWDTGEQDSYTASSIRRPHGFDTNLATCSARPGSTNPIRSASDGGDHAVRAAFPCEGENIGGFTILRELGRGTFSRVFLARQSDLAQRSVVLKMTATPMGESQRLARLQHANIMPLYSVHRFDGLFGLCMPFLGATTLKEVLQKVRRNRGAPLIPADGALFARACQEGGSGHGTQPTSQVDAPQENGDWLRSRYQRLSYVDSVLAIGLRLAEGLSHAHQRSVLHHDIKPANVLLAFDGEPLLMDFNLGRDFQSEPSSQRRIVGGTLPYMSPEQLRAMWVSDEHLTPASDVYSLGVLLYELLTGSLPHSFDDPSSLELETAIAKRRLPVTPPCQTNGMLPASAGEIVLKCLQNSVANRYQSAEELATDLRLYLNNYPNRFAANPSISERAKKFSKRHPILVSTSSLVAVSSVLLGVMAYWMVQFQREKLVIQAMKTYERFQQSLHLAEAELLFPEGGSQRAGLQRASDTISIYSSLLPDQKAQSRASWENLPHIQSLPIEDRKQLLQQISQLDALLKLARVARAPEAGENGQPTQSAINSINQNKGRQAEEGLNDDATDEDVEPFGLAVELYHAGDYQAALQALEPELEKSPRRFALWFVQGNCYFQLRSYRQAEHAYAMAGWTDRNSAICHIARAICYYHLNQDEAALEHLDHAQKIAPTIANIYSNRCLVFERQRKYDEALLQIQRAVSLQPKSARFLMMRSRVHRHLDQLSNAKADSLLIRDLTPDNPDDWIIKGIAILPESTEEAIVCFRRACDWPEGIVTARQNIAHVLSERLGQTEEAILELDALLEKHPEFLTAVSGRAVLHARLGKSELALKDVQRCLELEPTPETHYQIACVYSLLSVDAPAMAQSALSHLSMALQPVYQHQLVDSDDDLSPLNSNASFLSMKKGIQTILQNRDTCRKPIAATE